MMPAVKCKRCGEEREGLEGPPYNTALGRQILSQTCQNCFNEWEKFSIMVINDYKLRPFLPQDRSILERQMREFLGLI